MQHLCIINPCPSKGSYREYSASSLQHKLTGCLSTEVIIVQIFNTPIETLAYCADID